MDPCDRPAAVALLNHPFISAKCKPNELEGTLRISRKIEMDRKEKNKEEKQIALIK
jgi:hypothetical protein